MNERRCPSCGGLVGAAAEWCGQCFTRLDSGPARAASTSPPADQEAAAAEAVPSQRAVGSAVPQVEDGQPAPDVPAPAVPPQRQEAGQGAFRASEDGLRWVCPSCELENPLEVGTCERCGTAFRSLFEEEVQIPASTRASAPTRSLLFPGLGYRALGRGTEGVARGVTFAWMAGMTLAVVLVRRGAGLGPFMPLVLLLGAGALAVYLLSYVDARRIADRESPILAPRVLLYGSAGAMLLTIVTIVIFALRARG